METKCKWKEREFSRFADGIYKSVPIALDYPPHHYVHLSVSDTENDYVAYTPSDAYGEADRQVRIRFGKYLRKTFPDMTDADIQSSVTKLKSALAVIDNPATLRFATDIETINRIFETRMRACDSSCDSCMYGKFDSDTIRPYHVYANSPDVAVAYVTTGDDDAIVSRSVVSTKDKTWVRCYSIADGESASDCDTLRTLLADAGYTRGELHGNRLTKLHTHGVMLPYIDNGGQYVRDDDQYWLVSDCDGDYECDQTDGTATECGNRCSCCNCREEDCECYVCECCGERSQDGCEECSMCEECGGCTTHDGCSCTRCSECHEIISPRRHWTARCDCERCGECGELTSECECETEEETPDVVIPLEIDLPVTPQQIRDKLNRIYVYLLNTYGWLNVQAEYTLLRRVALTIQTEEGVVAIFERCGECGELTSECECETERTTCSE